jgi:hypothetical protein
MLAEMLMMPCLTVHLPWTRVCLSRTTSSNAGNVLAAEQQQHACVIPDSVALLMLLLCCRLVGTPIYFGLQLVELVVSWNAAAARGWCSYSIYQHTMQC